MRRSLSTFGLVLAIFTASLAFAHDPPHGAAVRPGERIDPGQAYPYALVAAGGGHFHVLDVSRGNPRIFAGTHLGLFVSHDRGLTWRLAARRFSGVDVHGLARDARTDTLHAATHGQGLLVSRDGGASWRDESPSPPGRDLHALALDPRSAGVIYVWSVGHGLLVRRAGTRMWERRAGPETLTGVESLTVHPQHPDRLYAGTARGVFASEDGGRQWSLPRGGLTQPTAGVATVPHRPDMIFAATIGGVFVGRADGTGWKRVEPAPSWWGPIVGFAFAEDHRDTIFGVAHEGPVVTRSLDGGPWTPLASHGRATSTAR